jgi:chromosome segregation ATPase
MITGPLTGQLFGPPAEKAACAPGCTGSSALLRWEAVLANDDLTLAVLREIRDEVRSTRTELGARLDETNARLDETNARLGETNARLGVLEHTMLDLAEQQAFVVRWLKGNTTRERRVERDLLKLTARVEALEAERNPKKR